MVEAYDLVRASLRNANQPIVVKEVLAMRIVDVARRGERDPQKLCEAALLTLGVTVTAAKRA